MQGMSMPRFPPRVHLAIDPAPSVCGFGIGHPTMKKPVSGSFKPPAGSAVKLDYVYQWVRTTIATYRVTDVAVETIFMKNPESFRSQVEIMAAIRLACHHQKVGLREVGVNAWRHRFLGASHAPKTIKSVSERRRWLKAAAVQACAERGWEVEGHDEADACGLLDYALALDHPDFGARGALFKAA